MKHDKRNEAQIPVSEMREGYDDRACRQWKIFCEQFLANKYNLDETGRFLEKTTVTTIPL